MKRLRAVLIFIIVLAAGIFVVTRLLPSLLNGPKVTRLPPGVKPEGVSVPEENLAVPVRTFKAAKIEFTDLLPTLGTVQVINVREGDLVKEGQELVVLDDREAQLRVEYADSKRATAEAQLKLARKRLSVNEELFRIGAIIRPKLEESQIEVEQAQTQVDTAEKEANLAAHELSRTVLKAPMDGVIGTRQVEPGEYVSPQTVVRALLL